jgi:hypothetical protein
MTELGTFKCDRCGKIFQKEVPLIPSEVCLTDHDILHEDVKAYDLCVDCVALFYDWLTYDVEYDKFGEELSKEKYDKFGEELSKEKEGDVDA